MTSRNDDDEDRDKYDVEATQLPDGRWTARTRRFAGLVGVGQTAEAAVQDLADAIKEQESED